MKEFFVLLLLFGVTFQTGLKQDNIKNFKYLGTTNNFPRISYFISKYEKSQPEALEDCQRIFSGKLVSIYTEDENLMIRLKLQNAGLSAEHVWTSGKYIESATRWEWLATGTEYFYNPPWVSQINDTLYGMTVQGISSAYGWHSTLTDEPHTFICQFTL